MPAADSPSLLPLAFYVVAVAFAFTAFRLWRLRRATREVELALIARRTPDLPAFASAGARDLSAAAVSLLAENERWQRLSGGRLAQLEATLGKLCETVIVIGEDNTILLANTAFHAAFPRAAPVVGGRFERVIHGAAFLECVNAVRAGDSCERREIAIAAAQSGTGVPPVGTPPAPAAAAPAAAAHPAAAISSSTAAPRWFEVTGARIPSVDGTGGEWLLFVMHDVTRQKHLEATRKDFVANVSHELRTPLSIIKGVAETLTDGGADVPEADRARFLRTIQRHSDRLASLLDDLLLLSRLESADPGLRPEPTDLPALLYGILDDYRTRPAAAGRAITADIGPGVGVLPLDPLKITQVIENLLNNALKYTPPGSPVLLTARLRPAAPDAAAAAPAAPDVIVANDTEADAAAVPAAREVEIAVCDHGPGIPAADLPRIFERFYRVDKARSRETGGTGLGLSIVKHIVHLHGGHVTVSSPPGHGATFTLTLPA